MLEILGTWFNVGRILQYLVWITEVLLVKSDKVNERSIVWESNFISWTIVIFFRRKRFGFFFFFNRSLLSQSWILWHTWVHKFLSQPLFGFVTHERTLCDETKQMLQRRLGTSGTGNLGIVIHFLCHFCKTLVDWETFACRVCLPIGFFFKFVNNRTKCSATLGVDRKNRFFNGTFSVDWS